MVENSTEAASTTECIDCLKNKADSLQSELNFYKPMFLSGTVMIVAILTYICCLILPSRRRKRIAGLMKVEQREKEEIEENIRKMSQKQNTNNVQTNDNSSIYSDSVFQAADERKLRTIEGSNKS